MSTGEISIKRQRLVRGLVIASAVAALFTSGWGGWHFFHDKVTPDWRQILPMFVLFDLAGIACAVMARANRIAYGRMGKPGYLVWLFAVLSGAMSASDAHGSAAAVRFAAPLVVAVMFELLIEGERREATGGDDAGLVAHVRRRVMARLGLLDPLKLDDAGVAQAVTAGRLATLAYRVHQTKAGTWRRRRAERRYQRRLRQATERLRFATNPEMVTAVRHHLAAMYQATAGTSPEAVADLNLWEASDWRTGQDSERAVPGQAAVPVAQYVPVHGPGAVAVRESEPVPVASVPTNRGRTGARSDAELRTALRDVPRDPDGTIPPRRAATALGCGYDRAKRLVEAAGLLPGAAPINGHAVPNLIEVATVSE